jgi:hypothetical protein
VAFPADTGEFYLDSDSSTYHEESEILDSGQSKNLDLPDPSLSSQDKDFVYCDLEECEGGDFNPCKGDNQLDHSRSTGVQVSGPESEFLDDVQDFGRVPEPNVLGGGGLPPELDGVGPTKIYQSLTRIRPNQLQRKHLNALISDTNIWYSSLEHWLSHGWNPKNIHGIIQLYQRGGPSGCRYCLQDDYSQENPLSILERMRTEFKEAPYGSS